MLEEGLRRHEINFLKNELDRRFGWFFDVNSFNFSPVYLVGTFLDPRFKQLLSDEEATVAIRYIKQKVRRVIQLPAKSTQLVGT